ncbi:MAG TPA: ABC transporter permease [bacterium]|nr:ABC transporter permease [bacterium]
MSVVFDPQLVRLTLVVMVPFLVAALGELLTERAGVLNVAIEGIMVVGAVTAFLVAFSTGSHAGGLLAAMGAGALIAALLAYFAITLRASQLTVGLGLFVLCVGLGSLFYRIVIGVRLMVPQIRTLPPLPLPALAALPGIGPVLFAHNAVVYLALVLTAAVSLLLFRTSWGLRLRAVGENPRAADVLGIDVVAMRYAATIAGGALIGLAGGYLPLGITGTYSDGMVGGRGWIALMLVIFGRWTPALVLAGALLFAYIEALQFKVALVAKAVPPQFLLMLPYVFAILVLIRVYQGAAAPEAIMRPYDREERA